VPRLGCWWWGRAAVPGRFPVGEPARVCAPGSVVSEKVSGRGKRSVLGRVGDPGGEGDELVWGWWEPDERPMAGRGWRSGS
jgi:hypothetical protein